MKMDRIKKWDKKISNGTKTYPGSIEMKDIINALESLLPEGLEMLKDRYKLLQAIMQNQPVGRRVLVNLLKVSERTVRGEVDRLFQGGLVEISSMGMSITPLGENVLNTLYSLIHELEATSRLEKDIEALLGLKKAIVVKGNMDESETVKNELGVACMSILEAELKDNFTVAITGGTTIAHMIASMPRQGHFHQNLRVIPARGSIGKRVEFQAHTIAVELAKKLNAAYELLAIPDNLSKESISLIKSEPQIQNILQKIAKTDIIIFGIGNAIKMAKRRNEPFEILEYLEAKEAVAESFRHYFNKEGKVVYATGSIGVEPEIAKTIPVRIAVAGGSSKAKAIMATSTLLKGSYLILDEGAAREIITTYQKS